MSSKVDLLSTSVDLILVSEARIEPTTLSIFNHPSNEVFSCPCNVLYQVCFTVMQVCVKCLLTAMYFK